MSSYIVEDITINRILSYIDHAHLCSCSKLREKYAELTKLGRAMLKMNIDATNQRYEKPYLTPQEVKARLANFKYDYYQLVDIYQVLKSLNCYNYQCAEGTINRRWLNKEMEDLAQAITNQIVSDRPEYEKAEWG